MKLPIVGIDFTIATEHFRMFRIDTGIWVTHRTWNLVGVGDSVEQAFQDLVRTAGFLFKAWEGTLKEGGLDDFKRMMQFLDWLSKQDPKEFEWHVTL